MQIPIKHRALIGVSLVYCVVIPMHRVNEPWKWVEQCSWMNWFCWVSNLTKRTLWKLYLTEFYFVEIWTCRGSLRRNFTSSNLASLKFNFIECHFIDNWFHRMSLWCHLIPQDSLSDFQRFTGNVQQSALLMKRKSKFSQFRDVWVTQSFNCPKELCALRKFEGYCVEVTVFVV